MTPARGWLKGVVAGTLINLACSSCSSSREAILPAPPRPLARAELSRWEAMPPIGPEPAARLPLSPVRRRLSNGLGVTLLERKDTPFTSIAVWVPSMRDTNEGPVAVMAEALRAGTRAPDGRVWLNPRIGGRQIDVGTGEGATTLRWTVLPRATEQALKVLSAFLLGPTFEEVEVDVQRRLALARISGFADSGSHLINLALAAIPGFERSSPKEDAARLLELNPAVLRRIHACTVRPDDAELVVVGPISVDDVMTQAERAFGAWQAASPSGAPCEWPRAVATLREDGKVPRLTRTELQVLYGSGDPYVTIAVDGPSLESEDYLPFVLLSDALQQRNRGSAKQLRHSGTTYGIFASVLPSSSRRSVLTLYGQLDTDGAQEALRALLRDISEIATDLDEEELDSLKRAWRNRVVNSMASNQDVTDLLLMSLSRKQDVAAVPELPNDIMRIDLARCRGVAERWLGQAHPSIVVAAGKPRTFIRGLGVDAHVELKYFSAR